MLLNCTRFIFVDICGLPRNLYYNLLSSLCHNLLNIRLMVLYRPSPVNDDYDLDVLWWWVFRVVWILIVIINNNYFYYCVCTFRVCFTMLPALLNYFIFYFKVIIPTTENKTLTKRPCFTDEASVDMSYTGALRWQTNTLLISNKYLLIWDLYVFR